jgi:hypothetical protein
MSLLKPIRIEDYIINHLKTGPVTCLKLVVKIQEDRRKTTKQAVYAALRLLKSQEQIIILKGTASLNITWINQMVGLFEAAKSNYIGDNSRGSFLDLEDKERIKYYFNDVHKADIFWTHVYYLLLERLQPGEPVFLYNPHEWFLIARNENEKAVIKTTIQRGNPFLLTSGNNTFLDKYVGKYLDGDKSQYNILPKALFRENNYYINIFGDFIIEAWLDKTISERVEKLYQKTTQWNDSVRSEAEEILKTSGRMRIVISRNQKKTEKIKKTLRKGFAITQYISAIDAT